MESLEYQPDPRLEQINDSETAQLIEYGVFPALEEMCSAKEHYNRLFDIYDIGVSGGPNNYMKASRLMNDYYRDLRQYIAGNDSETILRGGGGVGFDELDLNKKYVMRIKFEKQKDMHKKYGIGVLGFVENDEEGKQRHITEVQMLRATGDVIDDEDEPFTVIKYAEQVFVAVRKREISYTDWLKVKEQNQALKPGVKYTALGTIAVGTAVSAVVAWRKLRK